MIGEFVGRFEVGGFVGLLVVGGFVGTVVGAIQSQIVQNTSRNIQKGQ